MTTKAYDLIVIGGGPAGMSAATEAAEHGLHTALIDEQSAVGGQIYRAVDEVVTRRADDLPMLGEEYAYGETVANAFRASTAEYISGHTVWQLDQDGSIWSSDGAKAHAFQAKNIILATGALERPVPIPGWTLPGVMTAGAAQILLKTAGMIPVGKIVIVGSGPLLLLVADQLIKAGADVEAVLDTTGVMDYVRGAPHLLRATKSWPYLQKGLKLKRAIKDAGVPIYSGAHEFLISGDGQAEQIGFTSGGLRRTLRVSTVLLHQGVVPNTQASRQLRLAHGWHKTQRYWYPRVDEWGHSDVPAIFVAGDGAGVFGAKTAEIKGKLSALQVAYLQGRISVQVRDNAAAPLLSELENHTSIRPMLDAIFVPPRDILNPPIDATIVCRCEEVTAGNVRDAAALGAQGPNQLKAFYRTGMGPCQGRMCGLTVTEILAAAHNKCPEDIGAYRIRPPLKPLTLAELADMDVGKAAE
ncbi:FAD-dependent oxidoreductase [Rhodospirillales bacterium]|nr:FAD-dependent oxidoreductase [Rhodospirillales bacterium]